MIPGVKTLVRRHLAHLKKTAMVVSAAGNPRPHTRPVGMELGAATLEKGLMARWNGKHRVTISLRHSPPSDVHKGTEYIHPLKNISLKIQQDSTYG